MVLQTNVMHYAGNGVVVDTPRPAVSAVFGRAKSVAAKNEKRPATQARSGHDAQPDFTKMSVAQKIAFHKARWDRILD
jgi:hypothetical protein